MSNQEIVTVAILEKSPNGVECTFVKVGNSGMKIYMDDLVRDDQYDLQSRFHGHDLAPECWFKFDFMGPEGRMLYAYYSEIAETRVALGTLVCSQIAKRLRNEIEDRFGVKWGDDHSGNVGILNGREILIDFGCMRCTENV